jgi:hypothetical protein
MGIGRVGLWILAALLGLLTACEGQPENSAVSPTLAEPVEEVEIAPFSPTEGEPTYISVSQFPVAILDTAGAQQPAFVSIEMAGFDISSLTWQIGRYEDSCNRLVVAGQILPGTFETWPDGVHQASFNWPAIGYFLGDTERADFVYMDMTGTTGIVGGRFRQASTGETVDAQLLVDPAGNRLVGLQSPAGQSLTAVAGDAFQLLNRCLEADGSIRSMPGVELIFLDGGQLNLEQRPLASGDYFLHLIASGAENSDASITDFPVNNDSFIPDYQVYLNTEYGFQFLYPAAWQAPQLQDTRLVTGDSAGSTTLTVTVHPDMAGRAASDLKSLALSQFGNVTTLFEDQMSVGDTGALWTAYGYTGADGSHTGVLLVFVRDGVGYTVDMDGPETAEAQTVDLMNTFAQNWLFRPDITAPRAREWVAASFDNLAMPVMATYYQEELDNGWRRFSVGDGISFLAFRSEPLSEDDLADVVGRWRDVVGRGTAGFAISEDYIIALNGRDWTRTDFAYMGEGGLEIQGFVMAAEINGQAVIFWAEMPTTRYEEQSALFLLSLTGLR